MNVTEIKTRNIYRFNTGHREEQQGCNRNPRQENSKTW